MKITVISVGKSKEAYWTDACREYVKRLSRYAQTALVEVADDKIPDKATEGEERQILEREGARVLAKIPEGAYVTAMAIDGKRFDSPGLAGWMQGRMNEGASHLVFVIGGSLGLSPEVLARADARLSFSALTFPHQLARVMLLEQVYRSFRILRGEPYHK